MQEHGLLLKTADAVRAGRKLLRQELEAERKKAAEEMKQRARAAQERWEREDPESARRAEEWRSRLENIFGSAKVFEASTVLGLSSSTSKEKVQAAFRNLARTTHPDFGGDPAKFRAVVEARDVMLKHLGTTEFNT